MARILLADDNAATSSALTLLLSTRLGALPITVCADWESLLDHARCADPAVVLLDWELPAIPVLQGLAALRILQPDGKVIALSARPDARQEALLAGVDAFIAKSELPDKVLETIRQFVTDAE